MSSVQTVYFSLWGLHLCAVLSIVCILYLDQPLLMVNAAIIAVVWFALKVFFF